MHPLFPSGSLVHWNCNRMRWRRETGKYWAQANKQDQINRTEAFCKRFRPHRQIKQAQKIENVENIVVNIPIAYRMELSQLSQTFQVNETNISFLKPADWMLQSLECLGRLKEDSKNPSGDPQSHQQRLRSRWITSMSSERKDNSSESNILKRACVQLHVCGQQLG